ncbi:tol-pal system protein YbgF [Photobacterium lipolyticum]|uniref:Cell division coordinator CpoB n=1 Tax=Photobacterium lipolyticum TaxID=266810 RepID=A0A2T3N4T5_9GAMM|nr:tol-pal system protein YbgF [Photobacterium lipolyticum]PSW07414.1 tol-pal system protein YbgF [Photobacterium lipolyticum]
MNSNIMRNIALALLVGAATQVVAAPAPVTELNSNNAQGSSLERLERMLESRNQVQLDMQRQLDQLASEMDELRGLVERNSYDLSQMLERQRELYREVDSLSRQPQKKEAEDVGAKSASSETYTSNVSENEAYEKAVNLILKEKDYVGAVTAFNEFLTAYPESAYKPNAQYWLGQLYFTQNQLQEASENFTAVASVKDSNKRADAMLKLGVIAERSKQPEQAKKYYQEVISAYPDSTSSRQAESHLKKLGK